MNRKKNRIRKLEDARPNDILLFDVAGNTIFHWRSKPQRVSPALDAFNALMRGVESNDVEILRILKQTHSASMNFARLWEVVAALVEQPEPNGTVQ